MHFRDRPINEIGEFALIEHIVAVLGTSARGAGQGVIRGIGDDAAVLQQAPGLRLLAACDMLVEGRHFDLAYFTPQQVGWKALAVNLSDIAAMGGRPRWAMVSLALRPDLTVGFVEDFYLGMVELAEKYGVIIVGGDTCSSPDGLVIDVSILGEISRNAVAYRSGAHPEDLILVTGFLGQAAAGLASFQEASRLSVAGVEGLRRAHLSPEPRVREALALIRSGLVGAMNDVSDGLASELHEIVQASGCGARIWANRLPIDQATAAMAGRLQVDPLHWALYGGEDFELLFTVRGGKGLPLKLKNLTRAVQRATGTPVRVIGKINPQVGEVILVHPDERLEHLAPAGYNHFKGR